jgi:4-amino-4-deoxy-L-arabinose transferase-like glycosyltransferase
MRYLFWSMSLGATLTIVALLSRPLLPIDETRYLSVAWEARESGDYLVSHLNGAPYSHKPPLLFWLINLGWSVTGVSELAARCVSPIAGLACLALTWLMSRRLWPGEDSVSNCAPQILVSLMLWMVFSPLTLFDTLLTFCTLCSLLGVLRASSGQGVSGWLFAAVSMGVGILAKGPVVLVHVIPVVIAAPWWSVTARNHPLRWYLSFVASLLVAAAIALSWALPAAAAGGEAYASELLLGQTAGRMVQSFAHREPFWWYLPWIPVCLMPWIGNARTWKGLSLLQLDSGGKFLCSWTIGAFLILSLVSGKQIHYLIPIAPAAALLIARLITAVPQPSSRGELLFIVTGTVLMAVSPLFFNHVPSFSAVGLQDIIPDRYWAAMVGCACLLLVRPSRRLERQVALISFSSVMMVCIVVGAAAENFWPGYDMTPLANFIKVQDEPVVWFGEYQGQLNFLGRRPFLPVAETQGDMREWLAAHPSGRVIMRIHAPTHSTALLPETAHLPRVSDPASDPEATDENEIVEARLKSQLKTYDISGVQPKILYTHRMRRGLKSTTYVVFHI